MEGTRTRRHRTRYRATKGAVGLAKVAAAVLCVAGIFVALMLILVLVWGFWIGPVVNHVTSGR